ncbi:DUF4957 domain-containing protein [Sphingobacterium deserti]|uniref:Fibronectin type III domain protein n=1 Tax=Sphingobacterium deserti TaxID=1229276 RepID=A0A0B8T349_9SPHI|nr:DUF4957 domain-containing protein [Sphingobacterium deserti]KGE13408.1 fibronectin type III domain protein [Sphingobacterium deserti]
MKTYIIYIIAMVFTGTAMLSSCKKDPVFVEALKETPSNVQYMVQSSNVKVSWKKPAESFDDYIIEVSRLEDFSIIDRTEVVDAEDEFVILRGLDLAENHYLRIRTQRESPKSQSEWAQLRITTNPSDILLPILREHVSGNKVTVSWDFPHTDESTSARVSHLLLVPELGTAREIPINESDIAGKTATIDGLEKDMAYEVRIYNNAFLRGRQAFITGAESVNGIWTLSPHSDLKDAIERSVEGDQIVLRAGVYDFWNEEIIVDDKRISIKSTADVINAKVYVKSFVLKGSGKAGISFSGLDLSGTRVDSYKKEIPNTADTRWNSWLITVDAQATGFDAVAFDNCKIRSYYTGLLTMNEKQVGNSVRIHNAVVGMMGEDGQHAFINVGAARIKEGAFSNSTFYKNNKMFINVDREKNLQNDINFLFKNNTVDNSWSAMAFDFKASKLPTVVRLENNLFSNITTAANFFNNFAHVANDFDKRLINCNFWNVRSKSTVYGSNSSNMPVHSWELRHPNNRWNEVVPAFVMNDASHANPNSIKEYPMALDPQYENAEAGNFKIGAGSPLRNATPGVIIGDPRWW